MKLHTLGFASVIMPMFLFGCANSADSNTSTTPITTNNNTTTSQEIDMSDHPLVQFDTTKGNFTIELNPEKAPKTVANFIDYVEAGHYDGTIFHRVIPGFMVQGGGMNADMSERATRAPIEIEADNGLSNDVGTVAMARTGDPNSATSQFFVNVSDNGFLNHTSKDMQGWGYTVFGKVTDGMDTIREIEGVPTGRTGGHADVPTEPVIINSAKVVSE